MTKNGSHIIQEHRLQCTRISITTSTDNDSHRMATPALLSLFRQQKISSWGQLQVAVRLSNSVLGKFPIQWTTLPVRHVT